MKLIPIIKEEEIQTRIKQLGKQITDDYQNLDDIILIGLMKGSLIFLADLIKQIKLDVTFDLMTVSSYNNSTESSRNVEIVYDIRENITNKNVLIVEDIVDTGHTLDKVINHVQSHNPNTIKIVSLLDKPSRREVDVYVDYIGFEVENNYVVGYGFDYAQHYRNLVDIYKIVE